MGKCEWAKEEGMKRRGKEEEEGGAMPTTTRTGTVSTV
jgi:hypothetical protein